MPPNGFAGFSQQTAAVQSLYRGRRNGSGRKRRKSAKKKAGGTRKRRVRAAAGKLKKGSAAMKARMAKLRKMRRK